MPPPSSPTAANSALAPRSALPPASSTPADLWDWSSSRHSSTKCVEPDKSAHDEAAAFWPRPAHRPVWRLFQSGPLRPLHGGALCLEAPAARLGVVAGLTAKSPKGSE